MNTSYIATMIKNDCKFVVELFESLTYVLTKSSLEQLNIFPVFNSKLINEICDYCFLFCISKYLNVDRAIIFTNMLLDSQDDIENEDIFPKIKDNNKIIDEMKNNYDEEKEKEDYILKDEFRSLISNESDMDRKEILMNYYDAYNGKVNKNMFDSLINVGNDSIKKIIDNKLEDEKNLQLKRETESMKMDYVKPEDEQDEQDDDIIAVDENTIFNEEKGEKLNREELIKYSTKLVNIILRIISSQKKIMNKTQDEIRFNVSRHVKAEKDKITKNFENMEDEERDVGNLMKNLRLGKWSVGLTKSLFKYDADVYDELRAENIEGGFADQEYIEETMNELYALEKEEINTLTYVREDGDEDEDGQADY